MPAKRRKTRARRRNQIRRVHNSTARAIAAKAADEQQRPTIARHITQLRLLAGRDTISAEQLRAGERLYADWRRSGREPKLVRPLLRVATGSTESVVELQADAERAYRHALMAAGPMLSPLLVHVCLLDLSARDWSAGAGRREGDGLPLLRLSLDALIAHYRGEGDDKAGQGRQGQQARQQALTIAATA